MTSSRKPERAPFHGLLLVAAHLATALPGLCPADQFNGHSRQQHSRGRRHFFINSCPMKMTTSVRLVSRPLAMWPALRHTWPVRTPADRRGRPRSTGSRPSPRWRKSCDRPRSQNPPRAAARASKPVGRRAGGRNNAARFLRHKLSNSAPRKQVIAAVRVVRPVCRQPLSVKCSLGDLTRRERGSWWRQALDRRNFQQIR